ncbi:hypothetical protein [Nocardioides sp. AX2bis]|uniref:hypothetical protein n=1 Tax=Nocardioides sp. AX2bis TaxID=2653157 RepID=UPI0012EF64DE|nr:hypothetical protein [Nocardioides sp. AX2bis]VXB57840.1 conserved membrane hypothetical protein [Nocardioides sp. AX2bis]
MSAVQPLLVAALGLLLVTLRVDTGGVDATPDPLGWALVLLAVVRLPRDLPHRTAALALVVLAGLTSAVLVAPDLTSDLRADPALAWAVSLPALAATGTLMHSLTAAAREAGDPAAAGWLGSVRTLTVAVAVLPAVVLGAGVDALAGPTAGLALLAAVGSVVVLLVYAGRSWARRTAAPGPPRS